MTQISLDILEKEKDWAIYAAGAARCKLSTCEAPVIAKALCRRHYSQVWKHGRITHPGKSVTEPNVMRVIGNIAEIEILNARGEFKGVSLVDPNMIEKISKYKWRIDSRGYVITGESGSNHIKLHRFVIGAQKGEYVDHINHNPLDNRINNLRLCTLKQNARNRWALGVREYKPGRWDARVSTDEGRIWLGSFHTFEEARACYIKAAKKYYGEFAYDY